MVASFGPIIAGLASKVLPEFISWLRKEGKKFEGLQRDVDSIRDELELIDAAILDHSSNSGSNSQKVWISQVRRLANDIEDWIDQFRVADTKEARQELSGQILGLKQRCEKIGKEPPATSNNPPNTGQKMVAMEGALDHHKLPLAASRHKMVGMQGALEELRELVVRQSDRQSERKLRVICIVGFGGIGKTFLADKLYTSVSKDHFPRHAWVNASGKRAGEVLKEILEELGKQVDKGKGIDGASSSSNIPTIDVHGASTSKQVIRKVGFHGGSSSNEGPKINNASSETPLAENVDLKSCLGTNRYLIVIDDVQRREVLHGIIREFPAEMEDSRIIVTTSVQSVAYGINSDSRHMYKVKTLSCDDPKELFFQVASMEKYPEVDRNQTLSAIDRCDGLPLALVSIAEFMKRNVAENTTVSAKEKVIAKICEEALQACRDCDDDRLARMQRRSGSQAACGSCDDGCCSDNPLARMQRVLFDNYHSLHSDAIIQYCLLYFSMFPRGHPVKRNSLIRRWMAEELIQDGVSSTDPVDAAAKNLSVLIDRNVIQPIDENVKRCKPPGMMLEYISHKSMCEDFMRVLHCHQQPRTDEYIRRLSLHNYNGKNIAERDSTLFHRLRTLAVFPAKVKDAGTVGLGVKFADYKLLRVLDLEECNGLENSHLQEICDTPLLLLRYLSLGGSITAVPRKIARLKRLQTLDLRGSNANTVEAPIEVILLPELKHLLGVFRLSKFDFLVKGLEKKLSKTELETLAGFVIGKSRGISRLLFHMSMLRKIKIRCKPTADKANLTHVSRAIEKFIRNVHNTPGHRSLSVDLVGGCKTEFLDFLRAAPGTLNSLKLQGKLKEFPRFIVDLTGLTELCFWSTNLRGQDIISGVRGLGVLEYLKLVEDNLGDLVIESGSETGPGSRPESEHGHQSKPVYFPSLKRICLKSSKELPGITIKPGAVQHIVSLHLFSPQLLDPSKIEIAKLKTLKEVALQKGVDKRKAITLWKEAAKSHPNRPNILEIENP
uniref:NB-ARC domain-containing protein n=1 Tax=Oryza punctata TaxID=4537 RepID=A0A0E0MHZ2_ORYPU